MTDTDFADLSLSEQFAAWHERGELRFQRCASCRTWIHLPRLLCPNCGSDRLEWERSLGAGIIFSWTRTHRVFNPSFAIDPPYVCAVVELGEGPRLLSRIVDSDDAAIESGAPVDLRFEAAGDQPARPVFRVTER